MLCLSYSDTYISELLSISKANKSGTCASCKCYSSIVCYIYMECFHYIAIAVVLCGVCYFCFKTLLCGKSVTIFFLCFPFLQLK